MIGRLNGKLIEKRPPLIVVECHGVGYEFEAPMSTIYELPEVGENVVICTHLAIRDDAHLLYGFLTESERKLFRSLLKINGVGTKMALVILSGMTAIEFSNCVRSEDWSALVSLPGVGRKTAERLVLDMRDKVDQIFPDSSRDNQNLDSTEVDDAIAALVSLGYRKVDAEKYVDSLGEEFSSSEEIIRQVLKNVLVR
tara:strand:- start:10680 stop:11270 length:591 start_codon:yes stop_codon:yes gene_type:complete